MIGELDALVCRLRQSLGDDHFWTNLLSPKHADSLTFHLAVLREPYLTFILEGKKTVETRFTKNACAPYQRVKRGDVLILKRTPGDILGVCLVDQVWFYQIDSSSLRTIKSRFGPAICPADESFWEDRKSASVATLMLVSNVAKLKPVKINKRDRRGWVVLGTWPQNQSRLWNLT